MTGYVTEAKLYPSTADVGIPRGGCKDSPDLLGFRDNARLDSDIDIANPCTYPGFFDKSLMRTTTMGGLGSGKFSVHRQTVEECLAIDLAVVLARARPGQENRSETIIPIALQSKTGEH